MIRTYYYHGSDELATDLSRSQIAAARSDLAGCIWIDLLAPEGQELDSALLAAIGLDPVTVATWDCGAPATGGTVESDRLLATTSMPVLADTENPHRLPPSACLGIQIAQNSLVTMHREEIPAVLTLISTIEGDSTLISQGADRLAAELMLDAAAQRIEQWSQCKAGLDRLEQQVVKAFSDRGIRELHALQVDVAQLRRELAVQAELAWDMGQAPQPPVRPANRVYFRAAHQQAMAAAEGCATLHDRAERLMAVQLPLAVGRLQTAARWLAILLAMLIVALLFAAYWMTA